VAAMHHWSVNGVPDVPAAWLMAVAKRKALNHVKRTGRKQRAHDRIGREPAAEQQAEVFLESDLEDSMLRMIFACCHPDLAPPDRLALVLKILCGFGSAEVARALLIGEEAANKRLYRARKLISDGGIALEAPGGAELDGRLGAVLQSLYLLYNEGYSATGGDELIRKDLCLEAMRLCRLLTLRFSQPPVHALMALMCFHTARFDSRLGNGGTVVLFHEQDRSTWNTDLIRAGMWQLSEAAQGDAVSRWHLEASIAAMHCTAPSYAQTDWSGIRGMYRQLNALHPNPVLRLNVAIITAEIEGPEVAISQIEPLRGERKLARYPLLYATLGELHRRAGRAGDACLNLEKALALTSSSRERAFYQERLAALSA